jgi:hypothetical protein
MAHVAFEFSVSFASSSFRDSSAATAASNSRASRAPKKRVVAETRTKNRDG